LYATKHKVWLKQNQLIFSKDEYFHVRQAQTYCTGHFEIWDPKITTPPGLYLCHLHHVRSCLTLHRYLLSTVVYYLTGACDIYALRALNAAAIIAIFVLSVLVVRELSNKYVSDMANEASGLDATILTDVHIAANICLFPPLFFFSALYYTDVASTCTVMLHYLTFLKLRQAKASAYYVVPILVLTGSASLLFRQTNIFWVAIFPAGISVIDAFAYPEEFRPVESWPWATVIERSWKTWQVYSRPIERASISGKESYCDVV
jgi:alpha-1,2-glucosyltransferase